MQTKVYPNRLNTSGVDFEGLLSMENIRPYFLSIISNYGRAYMNTTHIKSTHGNCWQIGSISNNRLNDGTLCLTGKKKQVSRALVVALMNLVGRQ